MKTTLAIHEAAALLRIRRRSIFRWVATDDYQPKQNQRKRFYVQYLCDMHFTPLASGGNCADMTAMDTLQRLIRGEDRLMTVTEVAKVLAVSRTKVYTLIDDGELQAYKLGMAGRPCAMRILESSVKNLLEREDY